MNFRNLNIRIITFHCKFYFISYPELRLIRNYFISKKKKKRLSQKDSLFFVLCLKIRFLKFSIFEFLKNKAKKVKKQSISGCFCHFFEIMGNGKNADFYLDLGFSSKHKAFKVFVVFELCKNRFNIVTSLFSEFDAFFGIE